MIGEESGFKVLIAVPAYNEERNISNLLSLLQPWKEDVIVIDDGSKDSTVSLVNNAGFTCFARNMNLGLSGFYATAGAYAGNHHYTHLISLDADGQHEPRHIPEFIASLKQFDLVSGDRFHDVADIPATKIASNLFAIFLFKEMLNISMPDVACGFRGMKLSVIPPEKDPSRFGIIYEMLVHHAKKGKPTGFIRIPAIYHADDPMTTDLEEIKGLLLTIYKYSASPLLLSMLNAIENKTDFQISLSGIRFEARFHPPGAYCFHTDHEQAVQYFQSVHCKDPKTR